MLKITILPESLDKLHMSIARCASQLAFYQKMRFIVIFTKDRKFTWMQVADCLNQKENNLKKRVNELFSA
jgi:hypothetical protein